MNIKYLEEVIAFGFEQKIQNVEKLTKSSVVCFCDIDGKNVYVSIQFGDHSEYSKEVTNYFKYIGMEETMIPIEDNFRTFVGKL